MTFTHELCSQTSASLQMLTAFYQKNVKPELTTSHTNINGVEIDNSFF